MGALVSYEQADGIATVTMDDGKVNVQSNEMLAAVNDALDRAAEDGAVAIFTGRPGVFSAGFDLSVLSARGEPAADMLNGGFKLAERLLSSPLPVVIACPGHAIAMGSFLLLSADYRIGAAGAFRIVANEVAIGMTMPETAIEICRHRVSPAYLNRVVMNAETFAPEDAVAAGFLDAVVPPDRLMEAARQEASRLAKLNLKAHAATKLRVRASFLETLRRAIEADDASVRASF